MDNPPQQPFAAYPRASFGSSEKLQALADGYFGLNAAFVVGLVSAFLLKLAGLAKQPVVVWIALLLHIAFVGYYTGIRVKRIGFGAGWPDSKTTLAVGLMYLNTLCCGIVGFIVMQQIAGNHIKAYGIKSGFLGLKKKDINAMIARLKQEEAGRGVR